MIFLLGGRKNPAVRAIVGVVILAAGLVVHGGAILIALGAVLILWGGAQTLKAHRIGRSAQVVSNGRVS